MIDRRAGVAGDLAGGGEAVEPGHLDVHQDQVGQGPPADVDRVVAVVDHGDDVVAQGVELALEAGGHRLFVVGDEDLERPIHANALLGETGRRLDSA